MMEKVHKFGSFQHRKCATLTDRYKKLYPYMYSNFRTSIILIKWHISLNKTHNSKGTMWTCLKFLMYSKFLKWSYIYFRELKLKGGHGDWDAI